MAINSQLSTIEFKKQTKQTSRTGTESQTWRPFGGFSAGRVKAENRGKGVGIKKYKFIGTKYTGGCKVQYWKWSSQRTYMHDPQT